MVSAAKLSALGVLFVISFLFGLIVPYITLRILSGSLFGSRKSFKDVLGFLNCLSGGVFLASSFLSLLPEAREKMEETDVTLNSVKGYPNTETIMGIGFLLILFIESVTLYCHSITNRRKENKYRLAKKTVDGNKISDGIIITSFSADSFVDLKHCNPSKSANKVDQKNDLSMTVNKSDLDKDQLSNDSNDAYEADTTAIRNIVLLVALSIHMVFDGLGLGLQSKENKVWSLLLALSIHKILILFSMGLHFCESVSTKKFIIAMLYMSAISPLGIGLGIIVSSKGTEALEKISAVLQTVAVGTFIYVTFFEILFKEFQNSEGNRIVKALSVVTGFALFAAICAYLHE